MKDILLTVAGLLILLGGAEWLVRGASKLARMSGIPSLVVGLTVVAFGTSTPELAVSLKASLAGQADLAVGNVLGSNIFNVLFILGISALAAPLYISSRVVRIDVPVMIVLSAVAWLLSANGVIGPLEGALMLTLLLAYTALNGLFGARQDGAGGDSEDPGKGLLRWIFPAIGIVASLALLVWGSRWFVNGASAIARGMGVSELTIGLTLVAAGTSMPEAATSLVAALRGERDIAVGNVVGSNIFNILCVLALSGMASPDGVHLSAEALEFDMPIMLASAVACLPVFVTGAVISRCEGLFFLVYYGLYVGLVVLRALDAPLLPVAMNVMVFGVLPATGLMLLVSLLRAYLEVRSLAYALADDLSNAALYAMRNARKIVVIVIGFTLILVGVAMMVLPGPATIVIPLGLAVLGTEFVWARRLLKYFYDQMRNAAQRITGGDGS